MKKEVVVVIGDLIRSRKIADRAEVQRRLRKTLEKIKRLRSWFLSVFYPGGNRVRVRY